MSLSLYIMGKKMDKAAITKNKIYNKPNGFSDQDLDAIAIFIHFMRHKKKLEGILKGYDIDFSDLKTFK